MVLDAAYPDVLERVMGEALVTEGLQPGVTVGPPHDRALLDRDTRVDDLAGRWRSAGTAARLHIGFDRAPGSVPAVEWASAQPGSPRLLSYGQGRRTWLLTRGRVYALPLAAFVGGYGLSAWGPLGRAAAAVAGAIAMSLFSLHGPLASLATTW